MANPAPPALSLRVSCPPEYDLTGSQAILRWGPRDPAIAVRPRDGGGEAWRATRSPEGPATYRVARVAPDAVTLEAWGPGAGWVEAHAVDLLGLADVPSAFRPEHPGVRRLARRFPGLHWPRTGLVFERLVPAIIHQLVTTTEAMDALLRLTHALGERAPGPEALWLYPAPEALRRLDPGGVRARFGVRGKQAATLQRAAARASRLEEAADMPPVEARARLRAIEGVGPWTAQKVMGSGLGDPDAVPVGDFHTPHAVCWALAGEARGDDARMLELLEPFRGHRGRVVRFLELAGIHAPRRGPKRALRRER